MSANTMSVGAQMFTESRQWIPRECRACLQKPEHASDCYKLYEPWPKPCPGTGQTLAEDLAKLCYVQITNGDGFSDVICQHCFLHLSNAMKFVAIVQSNDTILRERGPIKNNSENTNWPKPILINKGLTEFPPVEEIKQEVLSDNDYDNNCDYDYSFTDIKIEPEEIVRPSQAVTPVNGGNGLQVKEKVMNGEDTTTTEFLDPIKQEPINEDDDPVTDVPLDCMLCTKRFKCVTGLKAHVIAMHSYKGVKRKTSSSASPAKRSSKYICNTCRRTFATSTDLMVHETCHNKSVCYSCSRSFESFHQLTKHRRHCKAASNHLVKPKTLEEAIRTQQVEKEPETNNENLTCSQCNQKFTDIMYLQIHQEIHNTDVSELSDKITGDNAATLGNDNNPDSAKDYLEKMLQSDDATPFDIKPQNGDDTEKQLQPQNSIEDSKKTSVQNIELNPNLTNNKEYSNEENDIVKESLLKLLESDESLDDENVSDKIRESIEKLLQSDEDSAENQQPIDTTPVCDIKNSADTVVDTPVTLETNKLLDESENMNSDNLACKVNTDTDKESLDITKDFSTEETESTTEFR